LLVATKVLTVKLHSRYVKESESGVGNFGKVGHFSSDSATLVVNAFTLVLVGLDCDSRPGP